MKLLLVLAVTLCVVFANRTKDCSDRCDKRYSNAPKRAKCKASCRTCIVAKECADDDDKCWGSCFATGRKAADAKAVFVNAGKPCKDLARNCGQQCGCKYDNAPKSSACLEKCRSCDNAQQCDKRDTFERKETCWGICIDVGMKAADRKADD